MIDKAESIETPDEATTNEALPCTTKKIKS